MSLTAGPTSEFVTSSIDFCEPNHTFSFLGMVEPWNALSSLLIGYFAVVSYFYGISAEKRTMSGATVLMATGIGSLGLHGTLHWFFQSADELPMLYTILHFGYLVFQMGSMIDPMALVAIRKRFDPTYKPTEEELAAIPKLPTEETDRKKRFIAVICGIGVFQTIIYYTFQSLYFVFFATFVSVVAIVYLCYMNIYMKDKAIFNVISGHTPSAEHAASLSPRIRQRRNAAKEAAAEDETIETTTPPQPQQAAVIDPISKSIFDTMRILFIAAHMVFFVAAPTIWFFDFVMCENVFRPLSMYVLGWTPHTLWHLCAGLGGHLFQQHILLHRLYKLHIAQKYMRQNEPKVAENDPLGHKNVPDVLLAPVKISFKWFTPIVHFVDTEKYQHQQ